MDKGRKMITLRPHHLLCTQGYSGKGYSDDFVENMDKIVDYLRNNEDAKIMLKFGDDDLCSRCPNMDDKKLCRTEEKVRRFDEKTVKYFNLCEKEYLLQRYSMKKILVAAVVALLALQVSAQQTISMQQLLRDMVSREKLAEYPSGMPFKAMQASSYNRASVAPNQPGWFADSDGVFCIRTEKNSKGETEWVLMEDSGPGVITMILEVCFYYGLDNTTGGNINIYLDGAKEPAIHCNFFDFVKGKNFVKAPLAAETRRAGNCYLPIPYATSCKVTMDKKVFYTIIQYRSYPNGTKVKTFTMDDYRKSVSLVDSVNKVLKQGGTVNNIVRQNIIKWNETLVPRGKKVMRISQSASAVRILTIRLKAKNMAQA